MISRRRFIGGIGASIALLALHLGEPKVKTVTVWKAAQPGPSGGVKDLPWSDAGSDPIADVREAMLQIIRAEGTGPFVSVTIDGTTYPVAQSDRAVGFGLHVTTDSRGTLS